MTKAQKAAWIMSGAWLAFVILTACSPATSNSSFTPTPTACVTAAPASAGSGQSSSGAGAGTGQSNPASGSANMPTLSASELATRQANLERANPGGPTTPVCPTPTPTPKP